MWSKGRVFAVAVCTLGLGTGLVACGGQPAVCDDLDALRTSVKDLQNVDIGNDALSTLTTDLQKIQADLKQLGQDASDQYSTQIDAVQKQASALGTSLQTATTDPSATSLTEVSTDVKAVGSAVSDLGNAMSGTCE
jgi:hypothetical protein